MENRRPSSSAENTSQKMFIETDKINEIVSDSDSHGGSFSKLSNSNMCKVNSSFSSSSKEEEVVQPEPDRGRKRTCRTLPKCANTDFDVGWKEQIQMVRKPAFPRVPWINKNFHITQDSSSWDIFEIFFSPEMFELIQKETDRYAVQQINKKKREGPLKLKSLFAQWNTVSLQKNIKILFDNHTLEHVTQVISGDYWIFCVIIHTPYAASVGMAQDRFLALLTVLHLNNNDGKAPRGQPGYDPLFKIRPVGDTLITSTHQKNS